MVGLLVVLNEIDLGVTRWSRKVIASVMKGLRCLVRSWVREIYSPLAPSFSPPDIGIFFSEQRATLPHSFSFMHND